MRVLLPHPDEPIIHVIVCIGQCIDKRSNTRTSGRDRYANEIFISLISLSIFLILFDMISETIGKEFSINFCEVSSYIVLSFSSIALNILYNSSITKNI